uniref:Focadhesin n=1 Tax=Erpetoichthys calabaricus TaxID=27687 RepID=A0A8C4SN13_ERPCA
MSEDLKKKLDFPSSLIQIQAVKSLVSAVLKENPENEKISKSSNQSPALQLLWERCCSDSVVVQEACCDALVQLVVQDQADIQYVMNNILNLIPSARNVHGLIKMMGLLLQIQAMKSSKETTDAYCPYLIRNPPHPFITVIENRPDCWPALIQHLSSFIQQCVDKPKKYSISVLAPFLRYLYCEPLHLTENSELRHSLLKILLPSHQISRGTQPSLAHQNILLLLYDLIPYLQINDLAQVVDSVSFLKELTYSFLLHPKFWIKELQHLSLHLLCACDLSLRFTGECSTLTELIERNLCALSEHFPSEQFIVGVSLLLLQAPLSQQASLLNLVLKIITTKEGKMTPLCSPILVLPLLQIVSSATVMESLCDSHASNLHLQLALTLLQNVQELSSIRKEEPLKGYAVTTWYNVIFVTWNILNRLSQDQEAACLWLHAVQSTLPLNEKVPEYITILVAYLIVREDGECFKVALKTVSEMAKADPSQGPYLVPVLMFKLGKVTNPELLHELLYTLPVLGTHKFCVPQILRALQMLGNAPKLRPVVLRLMTLLWERQDRVYPELQKFMGILEKQSASMAKENQWEQIVAKAACIRDICKERPYQHGGDMLAAVSQMLNKCYKADQATPAALALDGLCQLCRTEVVDIRSTWNALSPKLSCDSRPLVIKALADLFALVPSLDVKTEEYEKFKAQVVTILWSYSQNKDSMVASSAFKSLSQFSAEEHTIFHLPEQVRPEIKTQEYDEENKEEKEEEEDLSVPGLSYVKLIPLTAPPVLAALEQFLTSLVKKELLEMPRGVYHLALKGEMFRSDHGKAVAGIPAFMLKTYEKNRQPGLKSGLAAGLLLSYDLPIQTDRDGKPIARFLMSRGRSYQQMLAALIHEVNIQPSEWHRSILLPQGWSGFMGRAYTAVFQGRQAELDMQQKHGKDSAESLQYKQFTAWLWARDQLTDVIKSAAKDSPVMQGNSILALTGLAVAVAKYENSLPSDVEGNPEIGPEILSTKHWLSMVLHTLLSTVDSCYCPKGRVFTWLQHKSYSGENTASAIARSCASLALSLMVPVLITTYNENIVEILNILCLGLPGKQNADESQAVQFHTGLALGMFLSSLYEEHASEVSAQKINLLLMKSLDMLEGCCFDNNLEYNTGCILGVGLVLSLMSHSSQTDSRVHVAVTLEKLITSLRESNNQSRMLQEVLAYSVACVTVSAFNASILDGEKAEEVMNQLRAMTEQNQQTPGFSLALGLTVHGLSSCGHGKAEDLNARLLPAWIKILLTEGCPTMQRLAALNGLVALVSSESSLIQLKLEAGQSSQYQSRLNEVIRAITQVISFSGAIGLQSNASCLIGHLYLANSSSSQSRTSVPPDFGYLNEKSVVRAFLDYIISAGKKGPEFVQPHLVKVALGPLSSIGRSHQYPPVNWAAILSPLIRLNFGEDVQQLCIELAVTQCQSSQTASMFLGMWLVPPLINSLSLKTRGYLFESLSLWMKYVPDDKLQSFVDMFGVQNFTAENRIHYPELCLSILEGLYQAMKLPNPAQFLWAILCTTTEKILHLLPNEIQESDFELYIKLSKCLSEMADTEIDRITQVNKDNNLKMTFVRAYLVSQGRVPLLCLNDTIAPSTAVNQPDVICWILLLSFYQSRLTVNTNTGVLQRMEWLLELMGHIRNIAYESTHLEHGDIKEATDFLLSIFSAAVTMWADHASPLLIGVSAEWMYSKHGGPRHPQPPAILGRRSSDTLTVQHSLDLLPFSIQILLAKEPWKGQTQKFIDWMLTMIEGPSQGLSSTSVKRIKAALLALRFLPEFKKKSVWTRAYGW